MNNNNGSKPATKADLQALKMEKAATKVVSRWLFLGALVIGTYEISPVYPAQVSDPNLGNQLKHFITVAILIGQATNNPKELSRQFEKDGIIQNPELRSRIIGILRVNRHEFIALAERFDISIAQYKQAVAEWRFQEAFFEQIRQSQNYYESVDELGEPINPLRKGIDHLSAKIAYETARLEKERATQDLSRLVEQMRKGMREVARTYRMKEDLLQIFVEKYYQEPTPELPMPFSDEEAYVNPFPKVGFWLSHIW